MNSTTISVDSDLIAQAKKYGEAENRSATQQLEYWAKIGRIAQDNPSLTYQDITEILLGLSQIKDGMTLPYKFS